jgi:SAM-dependent methyltransferase
MLEFCLGQRLFLAGRVAAEVALIIAATVTIPDQFRRTAVSYTEGVFNDKNRIKRWLQRQRLLTAIAAAAREKASVRLVLDFGSGSGELCKLLVHEYPNATIICYEPCSDLLAEAKHELQGVPRIEFYAAFSDLPTASVDVLFCLEVFEHIPVKARGNALNQIDQLVKHGSEVIFGVPVEVGLPALYKGLFRMSRRFGAFDARPLNVLRAVLGFPPKDRPLGMLPPDIEVHHEHLGFDHRIFRQHVAERFSLIKACASPFGLLGTWFNPEAYFIVMQRDCREL